jgi:hypothetical protein
MSVSSPLFIYLRDSRVARIAAARPNLRLEYRQTMLDFLRRPVASRRDFLRFGTCQHSCRFGYARGQCILAVSRHVAGWGRPRNEGTPQKSDPNPIGAHGYGISSGFRISRLLCRVRGAVARARIVGRAGIRRGSDSDLFHRKRHCSKNGIPGLSFRRPWRPILLRRRNLRCGSRDGPTGLHIPARAKTPTVVCAVGGHRR